jgi:PAS domain-containing protein
VKRDREQHLWRELAEATRAVAEGGTQDLDSVLDVLRAQVIRLLGADGAAISLLDPATGELIRHRLSGLALPGTPRATPGTRYVPHAFLRAAFDAGRPVFTPDWQADPRAPEDSKREVPSIVASMAVPLAAGGATLGAMLVHWTHPVDVSDDDLAVADAFGRHAAVAIRTARLLADVRAARTEADAIFDAADDAVSVWAPDGRIIRANAAARTAMSEYLGDGPPTHQALGERLARDDPAGAPARQALLQAAFAGEHVVAEIPVPLPGGGQGHAHVRYTPLRDAEGKVWAVLVVARDVTDLHDSIIRHGQLDGALKTARLASERLGNAIAAVIANAEIVEAMSAGELKARASATVRAAWKAAAKLDELRKITRFAETEELGLAVLDIEAATQPGGAKPTED